MQTIPQPQPSPAPPSILPSRPELPSTARQSLGGRPPPRQSGHEIPVCNDSICVPNLSKQLEMAIDTITPAYQLLKMEDELADVDVINPDLNMYFEENATQQEGIINEVYEKPGKEYP